MPNFGCSFAEKPIHDEILNSMKYGERLKAFKSQDLGSCFEWWLSFPVPNRPARDPEPFGWCSIILTNCCYPRCHRFDDHPLSIIVPSQLKPWINVQSTAKCTPSSPSIHHHLSTSVFTIAKAHVWPFLHCCIKICWTASVAPHHRKHDDEMITSVGAVSPSALYPIGASCDVDGVVSSSLRVGLQKKRPRISIATHCATSSSEARFH